MSVRQAFRRCTAGLRPVLLLLPLLLLGACQSTSAPPLEPTVAMAEPGEYMLGSGDNVRVIVFGQEELSGEFAVDGAGQMSLPLIGGIQARGLTPRALEGKIESALADGYVRDPRVSVEVLTFRPFYIIGEVNEPGEYPYTSGMTAVSAVAKAGGYTYRARQSEVLITRTINGEKVERSASPSTPILPDDVIRIPERFF